MAAGRYDLRQLLLLALRELLWLSTVWPQRGWVGWGVVRDGLSAWPTSRVEPGGRSRMELALLSTVPLVHCRGPWLVGRCDVPVPSPV